MWGATQPAKTDENTHRKAIKAATIATGELRKLWPISLSRKRATRPRAGGVVEVLIGGSYGLTLMYLNGMLLSAICDSVTFLLTPHASAC